MRHTGSLAETVPYAQHSLTEAADIEHARTLLGAVLSAELPAMIDPGNFDSLPVQQHDKLCKLAAEVMRTACPDMQVDTKGRGILIPRGDTGMHIDGNITRPRGLRVHTNVNISSNVAFANAGPRYVDFIQSRGATCAIYPDYDQAERLFRQGLVNPDLISRDVYTGEEKAGYSAVFGMNGNRDVWHRYVRGDVRLRQILFTDVFYVLA